MVIVRAELLEDMAAVFGGIPAIGGGTGIGFLAGEILPVFKPGTAAAG